MFETLARIPAAIGFGLGLGIDAILNPQAIDTITIVTLSVGTSFGVVFGWLAGLYAAYRVEASRRRGTAHLRLAMVDAKRGRGMPQQRRFDDGRYEKIAA
jgi:hypothetical protein